MFVEPGAGELTQRVTLYAPTEADPTNYGAVLDTFPTATATVWARVEGLGSREVQIGQQIKVVYDYEVTIRWREGVGSSWQLSHRGVRMEVGSAIDPTSRRVWLVMRASTIASG